MFEKIARDAFLSGFLTEIDKYDLPSYIKEAAKNQKINWKKAKKKDYEALYKRFYMGETLTSEETKKLNQFLRKNPAAQQQFNSRLVMSAPGEVREIQRRDRQRAKNKPAPKKIPVRVTTQEVRKNPNPTAPTKTPATKPTITTPTPQTQSIPPTKALERVLSGPDLNPAPMSPSGAIDDVIKTTTTPTSPTQSSAVAPKSKGFNKLLSLAKGNPKTTAGGILAAAGSVYGLNALLGGDEPEPLPQDFMSRLQRGELSTREKALLAAAGTATVGGLGYGASKLL